MMWLLLLATALAAPPVHTLQVPAGFAVSLYAADVPGARSMTWGSEGTLFVGSREGNVYAIDKKRRVHVLATKLNNPNGVAFRDKALIVAELNRLLRYPDIENNLTHPPKPQVLAPTFPDDKHHGWKFIAFGPDGLLYVPQGAPCNVCDVAPPYGGLSRGKLTDAKLSMFARGIRNTVGFDWHPVTHALWFTDNGRDLLGDTRPPDELNSAPQAGMHFGFPHCHGGDLVDPEFAEGHSCAEFTPPQQKLGAHVASLGMRFYTGSMFPPRYKSQIFIAEHGSWNSSVKVGYRVSLVTLGADGHPTSYEPFITGWLQGDKPWGRPVDVLVAPDGALLVSDDFAGAIYRVALTTATASP